jgi:hypothetical protein
VKGEFKELNLDLRLVAVGSKPYMRVYGKTPAQVAAERAAAQQTQNQPAPPKRKLPKKLGKRQRSILETESTLPNSHLWLGEMASRNQLDRFIALSSQLKKQEEKRSDRAAQPSHKRSHSKRIKRTQTY